MQHCLYGTRRDGKLLVPQNFVYQLANNNSHKYSAEEILREFEQATGINLNISEYRWVDKQARTIEPELADAVRIAWAEELFTWARDRQDSVDFVSGKKRSQRKRRKDVHDYDTYLQGIASEASQDHPARDLIKLLNSQPLSIHEKQYSRTIDAAREAIYESLTGERREHALTTLVAIEDCSVTKYKPSASGRTCRIFTIGQSLNCLPSEIRKALLGGSDQYDLRSAQLAIAAKNWSLPELTEFLSTGCSIWLELASHCHVSIDYKPILKATIYSVCYGMGMARLKKQLADGDDKGNPGIGRTAADRFFKHPIIKELIAGRKAQLAAITTDGGAMDAFKRWIKIPWDNKPRPQSVLAQVAQSYELRIMLQILPILQANPKIQTLSWLHDGITLRLGNTSKAERWHNQIIKTVNNYCRQHGYRTELEHEYLPELTHSALYEDDYEDVFSAYMAAA